MSEVKPVEHKGATADPIEKSPTMEDKLAICQGNILSAFQMIVNLHHDLIRFQMIMDAVLELNGETIKTPTEEHLAQIDIRANTDTKKHFPQFFIDKKDKSSTT